MSSSQDYRSAAAELLRQHRDKAEMHPLSGALAAVDLDAAYAIQDAMLALREAEGLMLGGWKIALTTPVMQALVGIDHPCAGGVAREWIYHSPASVVASDYVNLGVESEIAVRIGENIPLKRDAYDPDTVSDYVAACMPAIEIVDDRRWDYDTITAVDLIADNSLNFGCVLGPEYEDWRTLDLEALRGRMLINADIVAEGAGRDVLGNPMIALAWLANHLQQRNRGLRRDDIVLLGSIVSTRWLGAGDRMETEVDGLGRAVLEVR